MAKLDIARIRFQELDPKRLAAVASLVPELLYPENQTMYIDSTAEEDRITFCVKVNNKLSEAFVSSKGQKMAQLANSKQIELLPVKIAEDFALEWWSEKLDQKPSKLWIDCCVFYSINLLTELMDKSNRERPKPATPKDQILPAALKKIFDLDNFIKNQMYSSREVMVERFKSERDDHTVY